MIIAGYVPLWPLVVEHQVGLMVAGIFASSAVTYSLPYRRAMIYTADSLAPGARPRFNADGRTFMWIVVGLYLLILFALWYPTSPLWPLLHSHPDGFPAGSVHP